MLPTIDSLLNDAVRLEEEIGESSRHFPGEANEELGALRAKTTALKYELLAAIRRLNAEDLQEHAVAQYSKNNFPHAAMLCHAAAEKIEDDDLEKLKWVFNEGVCCQLSRKYEDALRLFQGILDSNLLLVDVAKVNFYLHLLCETEWRKAEVLKSLNMEGGYRHDYEDHKKNIKELAHSALAVDNWDVSRNGLRCAIIGVALCQEAGDTPGLENLIEIMAAYLKKVPINVEERDYLCSLAALTIGQVLDKLEPHKRVRMNYPVIFERFVTEKTMMALEAHSSELFGFIKVFDIRTDGYGK